MYKMSDEQQAIIDQSLKGKNIFVDAVIGAGKTTLLNEICLANKNKRILYLTYNKLLKEDAKSIISAQNTEVHNYHGFVYKYLSMNKLKYTHTNGIRDFIYNIENENIYMPQYDMIVVDEYQDINDEIAELIKTIDFYQEKEVQLIFVGDMKQKIYDTTTIKVLEDVIFKLRNDYLSMDLTKSFRISNKFSNFLGKIWNKTINGVNENQKTEFLIYNKEELEELLNSYKNKDILILTPFRNNVTLNQFLSDLERKYPDKYNKKNLYITIGENKNTPLKNSMIVTTFDGSKGLERKLAIVFGWDTGTLNFRSMKGDKETIKNLYLVAASRGKEKIIFIDEGKDKLLNPRNFEENLLNKQINLGYYIHGMYNFVYDTDLNKLYNLLEIEEIETDENESIKAKTTDYNINLTPTINFYQLAMFFKNWSYEKQLEAFDKETPAFKYVKTIKTKDKKKQVLLLSAVETNLIRYANQAIKDFMEFKEEEKLYERLYSKLSPYEEIGIKINQKVQYVELMGVIDVWKDNINWELAFVDELEKKHFLEAVTYSLLLDTPHSMLWNTKRNKLYKIKIKDKIMFEDQMLKTITKT